ncbi:hypothetical protein K457DRAFT_1877762 [Linnemannia elongata AG-77]|uniref:Uncharacterized protein n=1 Tax=Linnemannia elongata AG-77 TaxID=1314771 RepID=A0A197JSE8_9FUNG|nr:hypothetical protein K457DRAFT_1877762 [Linnemannia elongata AG-77]
MTSDQGSNIKSLCGNRRIDWELIGYPAIPTASRMSRAAIKRHWSTHKHGAFSARRVAIPIANSDNPASSNLSTNGDALPPVNGNFPANDAPPVIGAPPADDALLPVVSLMSTVPFLLTMPLLSTVSLQSASFTVWTMMFFLFRPMSPDGTQKLHLVERVYSYRAVLEATSQELLLKRDVPSEERKKFKEFQNQLLSVKELNVLGEIIELLHPAAELHWIAQIESAWPRDDISDGMLLSMCFNPGCAGDELWDRVNAHQVSEHAAEDAAEAAEATKAPSQPPKPQHRASDKIPPEVVSTVEPKPKCPLKLQIKLILPIRFKITPQINLQALTFFQPNCPTRERGQHPPTD